MLEQDFGIADGKAIYIKAIYIGDTPAENKRIVVRAELGCVAENDLPDLWSQLSLTVRDKTNSDLLRRTLHDLAEVAEGLNRRETIRLEDELGFQILHPIQGRTVGIR